MRLGSTCKHHWIDGSLKFHEASTLFKTIARIERKHCGSHETINLAAEMISIVAKKFNAVSSIKSTITVSGNKFCHIEITGNLVIVRRKSFSPKKEKNCCTAFWLNSIFKCGLLTNLNSLIQIVAGFNGCDCFLTPRSQYPHPFQSIVPTRTNNGRNKEQIERAYLMKPEANIISTA